MRKLNKVCVVVLLVFITLMSTACKKDSTKLEEHSEDSSSQVTQTPSVTEAPAVEVTPEITQMPEETNEPDSADSLEALESNYLTAKAFKTKVKDFLQGKEVPNVYTKKYQTAAQKVLNRLKKKKDYTIDKALYVQNPYGTNRTGMYVYFETEVPTSISYTIRVKEKEIPEYTGTLYTEDGKAVAEHEGQLIGFLPGYQNEVILTATDEQDQILTQVKVEFDLSKSKTLDEINFKNVVSEDTEEVTDGLFTIYDYNAKSAKESAHILCVDNRGYIRAEFAMEQKGIRPVMEWVGELLAFPVSEDKIVLVNRLGKVEKIYSLDKYLYHDDFQYDSVNNRICFLGKKNSKNKSAKDIVVSMDLETGEIQKRFSLREIFPDLYEKYQQAIQSGDKTAKWLTINSIALVDDDDLLVGVKELGCVVRMNQIYEEPQLAYLLGSDSEWRDTAYEAKGLTKVGDFEMHGMVGDVNLSTLGVLGEGQYNVTLFNQGQIGELSWWNQHKIQQKQEESSEIEASEDKTKVEETDSQSVEDSYHSSYYKYLVDDQAGIFTLVESVELEACKFPSSTSEYKGNMVFSIIPVEGEATFGEYDSKGNLLLQFSFGQGKKKVSYRTEKNNFQGFWFNEMKK